MKKQFANLIRSAMARCLLLLLGGTLLAPGAQAAPLRIEALSCEYRTNPLGLDVPQPRLSWVLDSRSPGATQSAYRVLVASSPARLQADNGDLWDSGKVASDQSTLIEYRGKPLRSGAACHWKVQVWNERGDASGWSAPARWTMGILRPEDWTAKWISTELDAAARPAPKAAGELKILKATYLAAEEVKAADVTVRLSRLARNDVLDVVVEPERFASKFGTNSANDLLVVYSLDGRRSVTCARDGERLMIPEPAAPFPTPLDSPQLRRTFELDAAPSAATVTINVLGFYELYVNGEKVGPNVLGPALSNYHKRSLYETYDLTRHLRQGRNCIGLWLGRGWHWKGEGNNRDPAVRHEGAIARVQLDMVVDGKPVRIGTDNEWRCRASGYSTLGQWRWGHFGGERINATQAEPRWAGASVDDRHWHPVREIDGPAIQADAQKCPPMRVTATIPAVACTNLGPGQFRLDFGTALTGWLKLKLRGLEPGQCITLRYADDLEPLRHYNQLDRFISAGQPEELFEAKFNYHGFRWVLIDGLKQPPELADATAELISADWETAGDFACSSELLNRMHAVNLWTIRCLSQSGFLSDCPHRERLGYGDGQVSIESCVMNFPMQPFYDKWATDWFDGADPETGYLPHTAPQYKQGGGGPGWGGAAQALTWRNFLYYGDARIMERHLDDCRRHFEAMEARGGKDIVRAYGDKWAFIGDWVPPGRGMDTKTNWPPRPAAELFNNCYRLYLRDQWAQMADRLGRHAEAKACRAEVDRLRPLIHEAFYDQERQFYVLDEQSYYLMPLMTGVVPDALRPLMWQKLEDCIRVKRGGHLDTGMLGTYFLLNYLMERDRNDLVWLIVSQKDYPGWGHMLEQGATTWWEQWNGYYSQIHSCFTSLDGWFYQGLAGIRPDPAAPGFKKIIIKPAVVGDLTWVKAGFNSPHGRIVSHWRRTGDQLTLDVTIPANTTATVILPGEAPREVRSGQHAFTARLAP